MSRVMFPDKKEANATMPIPFDLTRLAGDEMIVWIQGYATQPPNPPQTGYMLMNYLPNPTVSDDILALCALVNRFPDTAATVTHGTVLGPDGPYVTLDVTYIPPHMPAAALPVQLSFPRGIWKQAVATARRASQAHLPVVLSNDPAIAESLADCLFWVIEVPLPLGGPPCCVA